MAQLCEVRHAFWIAAPVGTVMAQFNDFRHHIEQQVHPKLSYRVLEEAPQRIRYEQRVRLLGFVQRDVFERRIGADTIEDTSVEGFNQGGSLNFRFAPELQEGRSGTRVEVQVRLPVPALLRWLKPMLAAQVLREVQQAAREDKRDIESGRYVPLRRAA
jgi:uncharacterized membrane protein